MRTSTFRRVAAATLAIALTLTACTSDDGDGDGDVAITSLAQMSGLKLGVQSATTGESYANENAPEGTEIVAFENPGDLLTALQSGQVDAVLQDLPVNAEFARTNDGFAVVETYPTGEQYGFAVAEEGSDNLLAAVNAALAQLREGDFYDALFDTYFSDTGFDGDLPAVEVDADLAASGVELIEPGVLTVCSDIPYAPFEFEDADSETGYSGFDIQLTGAIADILDLELKVVALGFDPIQSGVALNSDQCDLAASAMTITAEREENLDFTSPYYDADQSLLVAQAA